jgi:hypothetical protein
VATLSVYPLVKSPRSFQVCENWEKSWVLSTVAVRSAVTIFSDELLPRGFHSVPVHTKEIPVEPATRSCHSIVKSAVPVLFTVMTFHAVATVSAGSAIVRVCPVVV